MRVDESTPLKVRENHFNVMNEIETEEHDTKELISSFKEDKKKKKQSSEKPNLNCTVPSMIAFIILGSIWGSAFSFST